MRASFYSPAPYPEDEEQRQRVVTRLLRSQLDLAPLQRLVDEAAGLLGVPIAAITLLDGDRQTLLVCQGMAPGTTPRSVAFCGHTILQEGPLCVTDARRDVRFAGNPGVLRDPKIRFYVGVRLLINNKPVGALCTVGFDPLAAVSTATLAKFEALGATVAATLTGQLGQARAAIPRHRNADCSKVIPLTRFGMPYA